MTENDRTDSARRVKTRNTATQEIHIDQANPTIVMTSGPLGVSVHEILPVSEFRRRMKIGDQTLRCWKNSGLKVHDDMKTEGIIFGADFAEFLRSHGPLVDTYDEKRRAKKRRKRE